MFMFHLCSSVENAFETNYINIETFLTTELPLGRAKEVLNRQQHLQQVKELANST